MIEKEYEMETNNEKTTFSGQVVLEQREALNNQISCVNKDMENYLKLPNKFFYLAIPLILLFSYCGVHEAWTTHLAVGAESPNHWTPADDHYRRYVLSALYTVISIGMGFVSCLVIGAIVTGSLALTRPYKKLKNKLSDLKQKLFANETESRKAMQDNKNRFNLLWDLESIIQQSHAKYSEEFMATKNLKIYQTILENAYVSDNEDTIEKTMIDIYQLPANLELQWQDFNAEKIRLEKHAQMKDAYWQYLKEEGKEVFPEQDFDSIARQTL